MNQVRRTSQLNSSDYMHPGTTGTHGSGRASATRHESWPQPTKWQSFKALCVWDSCLFSLHTQWWMQHSLSSLRKPSFLHTIHVPCKRISEFLPINFHIEPDWNQNLRLGCILMDDCWVMVIKANTKSNNTVFALENDTSGILHRKKELFVGNHPHTPTPQSLDRLLRTGVQSYGNQ